ncbi:MAG: LysR family transcriptional regulator [Hyphomicrobiales bacterium]|nr:MAG: LysR family transcriptional regulator [Hyphomicrobiales bacterium]
MNAPLANAAGLANAPLLELDLLRTLVAIAETGNFSAAADSVGRTPSAISMQVKRIEELLGRAVFIRDSRSVSLTRDGEMLLEHGRRLLALNREMISRFIAPDMSGEVHLGAPDDVAERHLAVMLRRFADSHPGIVVNVVVNDTSKLIDKVRDRQVDLSIITCGIDRDAKQSDQGYEILLREKLVWAALRGGVAAEQTPLPISVWEESCVWRKAGLDGLDRQGRDYRIAFQSAHISGQRAAILADLAVAPIPLSALGGLITEAKPELGLPALPEYALGLLIADNPAPAVTAAADHLRASFSKC